MADIVEHSGASIGSIYHHFGGRRAVPAIYDRLSAEVQLRVAVAAREPPSWTASRRSQCTCGRA